MYELKPISQGAVPAALEKAQRYRLLNEPAAAESICRDVLAVEPDQQEALVILLLALTDQLLEEPAAGSRAQHVAGSLRSEYERLYYSGVIAERRAKAHLRRGGVSPHGVYDWLADAMEFYERAEALRPVGNDDAILRWNACVRLLQEHPNLRPTAEERPEPQFLE